jgi:hypothetical protein
MSSLPLFAADAPFYSTWLTSIWLISVGALVGLLILIAIWGVATGLSFIPSVGKLAENRRSLLISGAVVGAVYFVLILILFIVPSYLGEAEHAIENLLIRLVVFAPLSVLLGISTVALISRRAVSELPLAIREGPLMPLSVMVLIFAGFGIVATFFIPQKPFEILRSLPRLTQTGETSYEFEIDPSGDSEGGEEQTIDVEFYVRELRTLEFNSTHPLRVSSRPFSEIVLAESLEIQADKELVIDRQALASKGSVEIFGFNIERVGVRFGQFGE